MSIYPTVRPSLTLDFKKSKQLDPRISFSRSSSATYVEGGVIKTADEHQARFEEEGLLIEESRTNLAIYSQEFDNTTIWTQGGITPTTTTETQAPDGSNTAYKLTGDGVPSDYKYIWHRVNSTADIYWQQTCYFKKGTNNFVQIATNGITSIYANFDLNNGIIGSVGDGTFPSMTATMTALGNGWYRCGIGFDLSGGSSKNPSPIISLVDSATAPYAQQSALSTDVFAWGMQVEEGSFPSSYIPTSGSTVTRSEDICQILSIDNGNWHNSGQGTYSIECIPTGLRNQGGWFNYFEFCSGVVGNGNAPDSLVIEWTGQALTKIPRQADKVRYGNNSSSYAAEVGVQAKAIFGINFADGKGAFTYNGQPVQSNTANPAQNSYYPTYMRFGYVHYQNRGMSLSGYIQRFIYYSERLTNEQLEAITL